MLKVIFLLSTIFAVIHCLPVQPEAESQPEPHQLPSDGIHDLREQFEQAARGEVQTPDEGGSKEEGLDKSESFWGGWGGYRNYGWGGWGGWGYPYSYTIRRFYPSWRSYYWW